MGYQIDCNVCSDTNVISQYAGETGKNLFKRGSDYVQDVAKKRENKPLWKHIVDMHGGVMLIPMFDHFSMTMTDYFLIGRI